MQLKRNISSIARDLSIFFSFRHVDCKTRPNCSDEICHNLILLRPCTSDYVLKDQNFTHYSHDRSVLDKHAKFITIH